MLAEVVLHLLPVSTGYRFAPVTDEQPIMHGAPYFKYVYSRGWNFRLHTTGQLNNLGYRSSHDYFPDHDSAVVIGNSFVQADALPPRETMAERLGGRLHRPVYAVGVDGFSLADYLATARWASTQFDSRTFVVLITTGDLKRTCQRLPGQHHLEDRDGRVDLALVPRAKSGRWRSLLNQSALYRYVFDNLKVQANWDKGWRRAGDAEPPALGMASGCASMAFLKDASSFLIDEFRALERGRGATVWLIIAPGYRREEGFRAGDQRDVDYFGDAAAAAGLHVIALEKAFDEALERGERLDFMPLDGHWNANANDLAAQIIAQAMSSPAEPSPAPREPDALPRPPDSAPREPHAAR